jgi:hypothetical protein
MNQYLGDLPQTKLSLRIYLLLGRVDLVIINRVGGSMGHPVNRARRTDPEHRPDISLPLLVIIMRSWGLTFWCCERC